MLFSGRILPGVVLLIGCGARPIPETEDVTSAVRCNADGRREVRAATGAWAATDYVCTTNVAVDDEVGSICATKADGRYRCWNADGTASSGAALPDADYARVQLAAKGLVGLTRGGLVHTDALPVPTELPPIAAFRATNLWGGQGLCLRSVAGALHIGSYVPEREVDPLLWRIDEGPFIDTTCAWEGLTCAVRADGTTSGFCANTIAGSDWRQIAFGVMISCGVTASGEVRCAPAVSGRTTAVPVFPAGPYRQVAATYQVACALRVDGGIACSRSDGLAIPVAGGPYVFIDAGRDVLCAIRTDGTSACFRDGNGGAFLVDAPTVTAFSPISPAIDEGW